MASIWEVSAIWLKFFLLSFQDRNPGDRRPKKTTGTQGY
jgi:hypothetical protein